MWHYSSRETVRTRDGIMKAKGGRAPGGGREAVGGLVTSPPRQRSRILELSCSSTGEPLGNIMFRLAVFAAW